MNKEEIIKISIILNKELPLTEGVLIRYGFSQERIEELIKTNILEVVSYKKYQLSSIESLYQEGITLLLKKDYAISDKYFEVCHQIDPQNRDVCLQIFLKYLKKRNYQEAYPLFAYILQIEPEKNRTYNDLYLYLMSYLPECPQRYLDLSRNINCHDILPLDNNNQSKNKINSISQNIYQSNYTEAIHLIKKTIAEESTYQVEYQLLKELLSQVIDIEKEFRLKLTYLAESESYHDIINLLEECQKKRVLSEQETNILSLSKTIINIQTTKIIPTSTIDKTDSITKALEGHNYSLAMKINNSQKENKYGINVSFSILLIKINEVIDIIKQESLVQELEQLELPNETTKLPEYSFALTSELFTELRANGHIPTKKEMSETLMVTDITIEHEMQATEDLAYYLKEIGIPLDIASKKYGILGEQILLIKLIYARDYYAEGEFALGDQLLHQVETSLHMTNRVNNLLNEIRTNKIPKTKHHTRKRKNKPKQK